MLYKAFISYSHAGHSKLPAKLQSSLERFAKPWYRMRSFRVFRDQTNLAIAPGLWPKIEQALLDAEYLLFLASPAAAQSGWVQKELALWLAKKGPSTLLIVLIDGDVVWDEAKSDFDWTRTTALPPALRGVFASEPLYVDFRSWHGEVVHRDDGDFIDRVATVAATLRGVPKDEIVGEHLRQHRRTLRLAWSAGAVLFALAVTASVLAIRAHRLQLRAEWQVRVANAQRLASESKTALATGYPQRSVLLAAEALRIAAARGEPRVPGAEEAMRAALANVSGRGLGGHPTDRYFALEFSPGARWLATETTGRIVRLWDLSADDPGASPLVLHDEAQPYALAFSADGKWLVTGSWTSPTTARAERDQSSVRIWNLKARDIAKSHITLHGHRGAVTDVALSADGRRLATGGVDGSVRLWNLTTDDPSTSAVVLAAHRDAVRRVVFSPDSSRIASGSNDGTAILWDVDAPGGAPTTLRHGKEVTLLAFTPDGRRLVTGGGHISPKIWNLASAAPAALTLDRVEDTVDHLAMSPNGRWLVTWGPWSYASLTDLAAPRPERTNYILPSQGGPIETVSISSHSIFAVTTCGYWPEELAQASTPEHFARGWNLTDADPSQRPFQISGHTAPLTAVAIAPNALWVVTASEDKTVRLWNVSKERENDRVFHAADDLIYAIAVSPDGEWIAARSADGTAHLWNMVWPLAAVAASPVRIGTVGKLADLEMTHDGRWMFVSAPGGDVVWDLHATRPASATQLASEDSDGPTKGGAFSRNDRWLAVGHQGGKLRLWRVGRDGMTSRLIVNDPTIDLAGMAFAGDGDQLLVHERVAAEKGHDVLKVVRLEPGRFAASSRDVPLPAGSIESFATSPDGRRLATSDSGRTIRVWTIDQGLVDPHPVVVDDVTSGSDVLFTPDGRWLMSGSWSKGLGNEQKTVRLWSMDTLRSGAAPILLDGHARSITIMKISADGHWLVTAAFGDRLLLWNLHGDPTKPTAVSLPMKLQLYADLFFSRDGRWLAVSVYQHPPHVWRIDDKGIDGPPIVLRGHQFPLVRAAISPDAHWMVTADDDLEYEPAKGRTCRLWDLTAANPAGSSIILPADDEGIARVTFSPDGRWMVTLGHSEGLALWHVGVEPLLDLAKKVAGRSLTAGERVSFLPAQ